VQGWHRAALLKPPRQQQPLLLLLLLLHGLDEALHAAGP
jgi:hypothetical protein